MKRSGCRCAAQAAVQFFTILGLVVGPAYVEASPLRIAFVQSPGKAESTAGSVLPGTILSGRYLKGMRVVAADLSDRAKNARIVTADFHCATDPAFSLDGTRMLFAGQRTSRDLLQIWELAVGDDEPRQVVVCDAHCIQPSYLPNGGIVFASLNAGEFEEHGELHSFSLFSVQPGGRELERLTFNPSSDFDPTVLNDGRILYSSWQHVGNHFWPAGNQALLLINADGTGLFPLTGNHRGPSLKRGSVAWKGDQVLFIHAQRMSAFGAGTLTAVSLNDPFAALKPLGATEAYETADVAPLPDGGLLVSARHRAVEAPTLGLFALRDGAIKALYDDLDYHELAPAAGARAVAPDLRVSTVVPGTPYGYLAILNSYQTDRKDQHPLRPDSIKAIRVIEGRSIQVSDGQEPTFVSISGREQEPQVRPDGATGYIPSRILGEVAPAADGSAYFKVPADRPLRIQLIDRDGFAMMNERAWFWVRPNERRVCIGCHEDRELSPSNAVPLATRRAPTDLTDPSGWQTVSFRRDIQPILSANCALSACHVPPTPTAGMNLTDIPMGHGVEEPLSGHFGSTYANLLARQENKPFSVGGRRVHPGDARSSPMMWMLYGRALAPQYRPAPFERPMVSAHPGPMLPEAQLDLIRKWIDLGAPYHDRCLPGPWPYEHPSQEAVVMEGKSDGR